MLLTCANKYSPYGYRRRRITFKIFTLYVKTVIISLLLKAEEWLIFRREKQEVMTRCQNKCCSV